MLAFPDGSQIRNGKVEIKGWEGVSQKKGFFFSSMTEARGPMSKSNVWTQAGPFEEMNAREN